MLLRLGHLERFFYNLIIIGSLMKYLSPIYNNMYLAIFSILPILPAPVIISIVYNVTGVFVKWFNHWS